MDTSLTRARAPSPYLKGVAILAMIFGAATLFSAGNVLFGADEARRLAGAYVPFVVWFNFAAGFFYILAAVGIWTGSRRAFALATAIAAATGLVALAFGFQILRGEAYEMRTVGALALRIGFWAAIATVLHRTGRRS